MKNGDYIKGASLGQASEDRPLRVKDFTADYIEETQMCLNCKRPDCPDGICSDIRRLLRAQQKRKKENQQKGANKNA